MNLKIRDEAEVSIQMFPNRTNVGRQFVVAGSIWSLGDVVDEVGRICRWNGVCTRPASYGKNIRVERRMPTRGSRPPMRMPIIPDVVTHCVLETRSFILCEEEKKME